MLNSSIQTSEFTTICLVIPSYNEYSSLPDYLLKLTPFLEKKHAIIVVDDSEPPINDTLPTGTLQLLQKSYASITFVNNNEKLGRGHATRQGMKLAKSHFPKLSYIVECDSDGSHKVEDVLKIMNSNHDFDLLIGSRYLPTSTIINWPISRKIFSKLLNRIIPKLFKLNVTDITNGLRSYSFRAIELILDHNQVNNGFIYLTETAIVIKNHEYSIGEIPTSFVNRVLGQSSVTIKELINSLTAVVQLRFNLRNKSCKH